MKSLILSSVLSLSLFAGEMQVFQPPTSTCPNLGLLIWKLFQMKLM